MADNTIDTLTTRFVGDATSYTNAIKEVENANSRFVSATDKTASRVKGLASYWAGAFSKAQQAMEKFGIGSELSGVTKDAGEATSALSKFSDELKKWSQSETFLSGLKDLRDMFVHTYDSVKLLVNEDIPAAFTTAWTTVSGVVVKSFWAVKTAAVAAWAAVAASPMAAVGAVAAVGAGLLLAVRALYDYDYKAKKLKQEFDEAAEHRQEKRKGMLDWANTQAGEITRMGPGSQTTEARKQLIELGDLWENQNDELEAAEDKVKKLPTWVGGFFKAIAHEVTSVGVNMYNTTTAMAGLTDIEDVKTKANERRQMGRSLDDYAGISEYSKRTKEDAKAAKEELETINQAIEVFRERLAKSGKEALQAIRNSRQEVENSVETLGMSPAEMRIRAAERNVATAQQAFTNVSFAPETDDNFVENLLATEEALKTLKQSQKELQELRLETALAEQAKAAFDLKQNLKGATDGLEGHIIALQMTNNELEIWKLQQQALKAGTYIDDKELDKIKRLQESRDALQELQRLKGKGAQLNEQFASPEEKYRTEVEELNEMLEEGYVKQDVYNKALEEAGKKFDEASKQAHRATDEVIKYDHALAGSQEAADRLAKQQELFDTQGRDKRNRPKVEDRLWLQQTADLAGNPLAEQNSQRDWEAKQYDVLLKIYDSLENPDPYDRLATINELTGIDLGI